MTLEQELATLQDYVTSSSLAGALFNFTTSPVGVVEQVKVAVLISRPVEDPSYWDKIAPEREGYLRLLHSLTTTARSFQSVGSYGFRSIAGAADATLILDPITRLYGLFSRFVELDGQEALSAVGKDQERALGYDARAKRCDFRFSPETLIWHQGREDDALVKLQLQTQLHGLNVSYAEVAAAFVGPHALSAVLAQRA